MSELCLKDNKVLTLKDIDGVPSQIQKVDAPELLPIFLKEDCTMENLQKWLQARSMPEKRENLNSVIQVHGKSWMENKNYASLTDQYWLKKRTETWKRINFFTNIYDRTVGDMFFIPWNVAKQRKYNNNSPDLTTGGVLMKRWVQNADKTSSLIKAGSMETHQEPLSEVLVSVLAEQLGIIPCVKYDMWVEGVTICSRCDNFIDIDKELVSASQIYYSEPRGENESVYHHLLTMCEKFDIPGAQEFIDGMIFIDNITGNEDRNLGNIGFIRDSNTMKFIGPAPLYDSGNAYWSTKKINDAIKSKMFGDIEGTIFKKLKKQCDLSVLQTNTSFKKVINHYPGITDEKKENLISAINKRNIKLTKVKELEVDR
jgi:hypothetical protein